jgi:hypothetical protein
MYYVYSVSTANILVQMYVTETVWVWSFVYLIFWEVALSVGVDELFHDMED